MFKMREASPTGLHACPRACSAFSCAMEGIAAVAALTLSRLSASAPVEAIVGSAGASASKVLLFVCIFSESRVG